MQISRLSASRRLAARVGYEYRKSGSHGGTGEAGAGRDIGYLFSVFRLARSRSPKPPGFGAGEADRNRGPPQSPADFFSLPQLGLRDSNPGTDAKARLRRMKATSRPRVCGAVTSRLIHSDIRTYPASPTRRQNGRFSLGG